MARPWISGDARCRTIDEARIVDMFLGHGWVFELRAGRRADAELQARAALDRIVAMGLQHRRSATGERLFDPVEALNFLRWAGLELGEPTFRDRYVATERRMVGPVDRSQRDAGQTRYTVTIRRTFNLTNVNRGTRVRLRLPLPLDDAASSGTHVQFLPPDDLEVETISAPGRLDVLTAAPGEGPVTVGVKVAFTASHAITGQSASLLSAAETRIYTRSSEGLIKISQRIATLACELASSETDAWTLVRRFWNFMLDNLCMGAIHYDQLDPAHPLDSVLDQGWYDCNVGSALFVALCRARGIPARIVGGYTLHPAAPHSHNWIEVWISGAGWIPFDLSSWGLSAGGQDADWRDYYLGQLDDRMVVECLPFMFAGTGTVRLPASWHMLTSLDTAGCVVEFRARDNDILVYRENVQVECDASDR